MGGGEEEEGKEGRGESGNMAMARADCCNSKSIRRDEVA